MRRKGHRLKQIIDSWSRGQGEPDAFIFLITFEICWYVGGSRLNGITGSDKVGIDNNNNNNNNHYYYYQLHY